MSLKKHLVEATALITVGNPAFTALEMICGMPHQTSINARLYGTGLIYLGLASLITKGREYSKNYWKINTEEKKHLLLIHDAFYSMSVGLITSPFFYWAMGGKNVKEIAIGTAVSACLGLGLGIPSLYAVDAFNDFANIEPSERLPKIIKNKSKKTKKNLMALTALSSLGLTAGIYAFTP